MLAQRTEENKMKPIEECSDEELVIRLYAGFLGVATSSDKGRRIKIVNDMMDILRCFSLVRKEVGA